MPPPPFVPQARSPLGWAGSQPMKWAAAPTRRWPAEGEQRSSVVVVVATARPLLLPRRGRPSGGRPIPHRCLGGSSSGGPRFARAAPSQSAPGRGGRATTTTAETSAATEAPEARPELRKGEKEKGGGECRLRIAGRTPLPRATRRPCSPPPHPPLRAPLRPSLARRGSAAAAQSLEEPGRSGALSGAAARGGAAGTARAAVRASAFRLSRRFSPPSEPQPSPPPAATPSAATPRRARLFRARGPRKGGGASPAAPLLPSLRRGPGARPWVLAGRRQERAGRARGVPVLDRRAANEPIRLPKASH